MLQVGRVSTSTHVFLQGYLGLVAWEALFTIEAIVSTVCSMRPTIVIALVDAYIGRASIMIASSAGVPTIVVVVVSTAVLFVFTAVPTIVSSIPIVDVGFFLVTPFLFLLLLLLPQFCWPPPLLSEMAFIMNAICCCMAWLAAHI